MSTHREKELETFQAAVEKYIKPLANPTLSFVQIDKELYALVAADFYFKFYCAGGHGYSFTVTIGPKYQPKWNTEDERGFSWLVRYDGEDDWKWTYDRYYDPLSFAEGIAHVAGLLPKYIAFLRTINAPFWKEFDNFVKTELAQATAEDKRKT